MAAGAVNPQAVQRAMRRFFRGRYPARQSSAKAWLGLRARCPQSALVPLVFSRPCHLLLQAFLDRFMIHPSDDAASTIQWLYRHAKGAPESTAVVTPARQYTYGELASRVLAVAAELQRIGVAPGMLIGIETNDRFAHLATVLACDVIGATTLSFYASEFDASRDELGRCSMLLHDRDLPAAVTTAAPRRIRTILGAAAHLPPPSTSPDLTEVSRRITRSASYGLPAPRATRSAWLSAWGWFARALIALSTRLASKIPMRRISLCLTVCPCARLISTPWLA